ncbi:MAG: nuclear transport factor 2 family protein [Sphingomonas sp.]
MPDPTPAEPGVTVPLADRLAIHELLALHGHLIDAGELEALDRVLAADARDDVSALGGTVLIGPAACREAALELGDGNPVAHHVTNIVLDAIDADTVAARSKGIGIMRDGRCGSVVYHDIIRRQADGWRIAERTVLPRKQPLVRQ